MMLRRERVLPTSRTFRPATLVNVMSSLSNGLRAGLVAALLLGLVAGCDAPLKAPPACRETMACDGGLVCVNESCVACGADAPCQGSLFCLEGKCGAPSCSDGAKNGGEPSVDCGGPCAACAAGLSCLRAADCETALCQGGICVAKSCTDGVLGEGETDVDCGGACGACFSGASCLSGDDCASHVCVAAEGMLAFTCLEPACDDDVKNGSETGTDCGGRCPDACAATQGCRISADCLSRVCSGETGARTCQTATCDDRVRNAGEGGLDCAGPCEACEIGETCSVDGDCTSRLCSAGICLTAACTDGLENQDEKGIDCGGACRVKCDGDVCAQNEECRSQSCADEDHDGTGVCVAPTCDDGSLNGRELQADCGGDCHGCEGSPCQTDDSCASTFCRVGLCAKPTCFDGVRNGKEDGVDCGKALGCGLCPGEKCRPSENDCASSVCDDPDNDDSGFCLAPTCQDRVGNGLEAGRDCGGPACGECDGDPCALSADCLSQVCARHVCAVPGCLDGVQNGEETGPDCGGRCGLCAGDPNGCREDAECASQRCVDQQCASPTCDDHVRNGLETEIDCGGPECRSCAREICSLAADCASNACVLGRCRPPSCQNGRLDPGEGQFGLDAEQRALEPGGAQVDCGGVCGACVSNKCEGPVDCASGRCRAGICVRASCANGVLDAPGEREIDCGPVCGACDYDRVSPVPQGNACASGHALGAAVESGGGAENDAVTALYCSRCTKGGKTDAKCLAECLKMSEAYFAECARAGGKAADGSCAISYCKRYLEKDPVLLKACLEAGKAPPPVDVKPVDCVEVCATAPEPRACRLSCDAAFPPADFRPPRDRQEQEKKAQAPPEGAERGRVEADGERREECRAFGCEQKGAVVLCVPASCSDGIVDGNEVDIDCGGSCGACERMACTVGTACASGHCAAGRCAPPTCDDGAKNGDERFIDCGGSCRLCENQECVAAESCASGVCATGLCLEASCHDGGKTAEEEAIDCGGRCPRCPEAACTKTRDCGGGLGCVNGRCRAPSCLDGLQNQDEVGVDCGGSHCLACKGTACLLGRDCASGLCAGAACTAPECEDGVRNQGELGVDCGGPCGLCPGAPCVAELEKCAPGSTCVNDAACVQTLFELRGEGRSSGDGVTEYDIACERTERNRCEHQHCFDGVQNGGETAIDCGGAECGGCAGAVCVDDLACGQGLSCDSGTCLLPASCDDLSAGTFGQVRAGLFSVDPDRRGAQPPLEVSCLFETGGREATQTPCSRDESCRFLHNFTLGKRAAAKGWTLVQRTVWDPVENAPLQTSYADWRTRTLGLLAPGKGYRLAGSHWPLVGARGEHLFAYEFRSTAGAACDPARIFDRGWGAAETAKWAVTDVDATLLAPNSLFGDRPLSTATQGPSSECVTRFGGLPWVYNYCCSRCPLLGGFFDVPRPVIDVAALSNVEFDSGMCFDGSLPVEAQTTVPGRWFGVNSFEYFVR